MTADRVAGRSAQTLARAGHSSVVITGVGVAALAAGFVVLVWPSATLKVIAVVFGVFALLDGIFRLVSALTPDEQAAPWRVLPALQGVLSILVGIVFVRYPFQTLAVLTLVLGMFWVVSGLVQIVHGIAERGTGGRWRIAGGALALITGILVLAYTSASLLVLVWLLGIQLILTGVLLTAWAAQIHREEHPAVPRHRHSSAEA